MMYLRQNLDSEKKVKPMDKKASDKKSILRIDRIEKSFNVNLLCSQNMCIDWHAKEQEEQN